MAGYNGFSMSNNAVEAYHNGEKPLSRWNKREIIQAIKELDIELKCSLEKLQAAPLQVLKDRCLYCSSWHHTSKHYNRTDFYSIDEDEIAELTDTKIDEYIACYNEAKSSKNEEKEEKWECAFLEWTGTRNHMKAREVIEEGVIKGEWFYRKDGTKKKTTANGFRRLRELND